MADSNLSLNELDTQTEKAADAGTESERLQETASSSDSITAKPAEQLLRTVSRVDESEDHTHNEETQIQQLRIDCFSRRHEISAKVDA